MGFASSGPRRRSGGGARRRGPLVERLRARLADRQDLGGDPDRDHARLLALQAGERADRADDACEVGGRSALGGETFLELRALGFRADQPEVGPVVALERRLDDVEVERVAVGGDDDEGAARRVARLAGRVVGGDDLDVVGDRVGERLLALIDPADVAGQRAQDLDQRAADPNDALAPDEDPLEPGDQDDLPLAPSE